VRAVKSIKQKIMPDDKRNELIAEIEILRELDHPNIIKLF
jgi:serine/threonine protein kinase